jgi:translation elongation factor EF-Tu-like GTPase
MQFVQGNGVTRNVVVSGIERNRQLCNEAKYGDIVGVFLKGLRGKNEISIGTQLRIKEQSQVTQ